MTGIEGMKIEGGARDALNPTAEEARAMRAQGKPWPRAAEWSKGVQQVVAEDEVAALKERIAKAKAEGAPISMNDAYLYEWALKNNLILPEKELIEMPAKDLIMKGFEQHELDNQGEVMPFLNELTKLAQDADAAAKAPAWHDFAGKMAARKTVRELRERFAAVETEMTKALGRVQSADFRAAVGEHINTLRGVLEGKE